MRSTVKFELLTCRGIARPGVMVGPLCDHYFAATWLKAIFHAIRQYSQNKTHYSFQTKVHCNLLKTNYA